MKYIRFSRLVIVNIYSLTIIEGGVAVVVAPLGANPVQVTGQGRMLELLEELRESRSDNETAW